MDKNAAWNAYEAIQESARRLSKDLSGVYEVEVSTVFDSNSYLEGRLIGSVSNTHGEEEPCVICVGHFATATIHITPVVARMIELDEDVWQT